MIYHNGILPDALLYDAACALKLYWDKCLGTELLPLTSFTRQLPTHVAIDRFHQPNHSRSICKTIMRADDSSHGDVFKHVNSQIAEEFFKHFSRFKSSLRTLNFPISTIIGHLICHLKNCKVTRIDPNSFGLSARHFSAIIRHHYSTSTIFQEITKEQQDNRGIKLNAMETDDLEDTDGFDDEINI